MIGLGGLIYLLIGGPLGAFLFSIGLLGILSQGMKLYTGIAGDEVSWNLGLVLIGNVIGTGIIALLSSFTFPDLLLPDLSGRFNLFGTFIRAIFCGILMTAAVRGYRKGVIWLPVICVMAFILSSFSHSIADSYYYFLLRDPSYCFPWILSVLGNLIGCNIPYKKWIKDK